MLKSFHKSLVYKSFKLKLDIRGRELHSENKSVYFRRGSLASYNNMSLNQIMKGLQNASC